MKIKTYIRITTILFFFLCICSSNTFAKKFDNIDFLENRNIRLGFDKGNGTLVSFEDLTYSENLLELNLIRKSLWQIDFKEGTERFSIDMNSAREFNIEKTEDNSFKLKWGNFKNNSVSNLSVTVSVRLKEANSFWKINITGIKGKTVEKVIFPRVSGLKDLKEEYLAVANWTGDLLENPRNFYSGNGGGVWTYPGHLSMQLVTLYNPDKIGFYASCNDSLSYKKNFCINMEDKDMIYRMENYPSIDLSLDSYSPQYEAIIGSYKGDWFTAAEKYREWARQQKWAKESRLKNKQVPEWVEQTALWVWNRDESSGVLNPAVELKKRINLPISVLWHWWHGCSYDDGFPEYFPPREGKDKFIKQLNYAKSEGVRTSIYMNQIQWGNSTKSWKEENAIRYAIKDINGKEHNHVFNIFSQKALTLMCLGTDFWKEKYASLADTAINNYGVDGIYMDQTCLSYFCYDPTHFHPTGGGNYWVENSGKLAKKIRTLSEKEVLPALSGEGSSENWLPHLDMFLTLEVSRERYAGSKGWKPIPLFQVVYHPYAITFGSYSSLLSPPYDQLWPKEFAPKDTLTLLDKKFNNQFLMEQARSFTWGLQPMISNYRTFLDTERKEEVDYLIKIAKVRFKALKYLLYGEYIRMPYMKYPEKEIKISKLSIYAGRQGNTVTEQEGVYPMIYSSAWKAEDGNIALAFASIDNKTFPIELTLAAKEYNLSSSGKIYLISEKDRKELGTYQNGQIKIKTQLPAKEIFIIEIEPSSY